MIINLETDKPKSIEQRVQEHILKKLFVKVDDEQIFIDKEDFIALILRDVIALAKGDFDIDTALKLALKEQPEYAGMRDSKRIELEEALGEFEVEVIAYNAYLSDREDNLSDSEIVEHVLRILNDDEEFFQAKMHGILVQTIGEKVPEEHTRNAGLDRDALLTTYATYVRMLSEASPAEVADDLYSRNSSASNPALTKDFMRAEIERIAPALADEISAYKMALSLKDQNAELPMIFAMMNQMLSE